MKIFKDFEDYLRRLGVKDPQVRRISLDADWTLLELPRTRLHCVVLQANLPAAMYDLCTNTAASTITATSVDVSSARDYAGLYVSVTYTFEVSLHTPCLYQCVAELLTTIPPKESTHVDRN